MSWHGPQLSKFRHEQRSSFKNAILLLIKEFQNLRELEQIHSQIITYPKLSKSNRFYLLSRLLFFSAIPDSGSLAYAARIFRVIENPNLQMYNVMIRAYCFEANSYLDPHFLHALITYKQMLAHGIAPDVLTFPFLVKGCTNALDRYSGESVHGQVIKSGFTDELFVQNSMINFYWAVGFVNCARKLFDEMSERDVVSWNTMVTGLFRSGDVDDAIKFFKEMGKKNTITWNSAITCLVWSGRPRDALELFYNMVSTNEDDNIVKPDKMTITSVLTACASLGAIHHGQWVHRFLEKRGLQFDMVLGTALVDMYGKCGCLDRAYDVFEKMPERDTQAWTAMILAFALNGHDREAFDVFRKMEMEGVMPNHVTFVGLLSACSHSGLVEKGRQYFNAMQSIYSIEPHVHHYACMVGLLSRAGLLEEAERLIRSMPMEPGVFVWGALLGGCQIHGNMRLGEKVARCLIDLQPWNHAFYINLCDIYAKAGRFDEVKRVRHLMKQRRVMKEIVGCSSIEIDGVANEFTATTTSIPSILVGKITCILDSLHEELKMIDTS